MALQAIVPFIPLIQKIIEVRHEAKKNENSLGKQALEKAKQSTGKTEIAQGGYIYALYSIGTTIHGCEEGFSIASLACVTPDQWVMLSAFVSMAYATLRAKIK